MVSDIALSTLLELKDINQRNDAIRKVFSAYTPLVDVSGQEKQVLIILLNLTYKRTLVDDLCDIELAKATLKNKAHIDKCINEVNWLHSHNLKYPDIRVSRQRLIVPAPTKMDSAISSANYAQATGWSHDSAKINLVRLLVSHFCWQGEQTCLAKLMAAESDVWGKVFKSLGLTFKDYNKLCTRVQHALPESDIPKHIDTYSKQILLPYQNGYIAVTPVVSHTIQSEIQQLLRSKKGRYTSIIHTRPSSVSELAASLGGNISVLCYPPKVSLKPKSYSDIKVGRINNRSSCFYNKPLLSKGFVKALDTLIYSDGALTHKKRRQIKLHSYKQVRAGLVSWLSPITQWRLDVNENNNRREVELNVPTFIKQLLVKTKPLTETEFTPIFAELNTYLPSQYAYHPSLLLPLRGLLLNAINKVLNIQNINLQGASTHNNKRYFYLKKLNVFDAQALSNPYCVGLPSITAMWGMIHSWQRKINEYLNINVRLHSFAWFIRRYQMVDGYRTLEYTVRNSDSQFKRPGLIDERFCDVLFDVVVTVYGREEDLNKLLKSQDIVIAALPARLAGGTMFPYEMTDSNTWFKLINSDLKLIHILKRLPNFGKWVMPTNKSISNLDELVQLLDEDSSYLPVMVGFALLEKPQRRKGSIATEHCFAEPLIGLAQLKDAIETKLNVYKSFLHNAFWQLDANENHVIITKARNSDGTC